MPDRSLDSLSSAFLPLALTWIARCVERGVSVMIIQTSRTPVEHQANLVNGTSGTTLSLHLLRRLLLSQFATELAMDSGLSDPDKADAMDLAPWDIYQAHGPDKINWNSKSREFGIIATECEKLGLRSGVRWTKPFDPGHGELVLPVKERLLVEERSRPWPTFNV